MALIATYRKPGSESFPVNALDHITSPHRLIKGSGDLRPYGFNGRDK